MRIVSQDGALILSWDKARIVAIQHAGNDDVRLPCPFEALRAVLSGCTVQVSSAGGWVQFREFAGAVSYEGSGDGKGDFRGELSSSELSQMLSTLVDSQMRSG